MKLLVFSICKDEAETIGEVLDRIPRKIKGIKEVEKWVISDGSTDDTVEVAKRHGARVVDDIVQKRLAFRFQEAIDIALERGADVAVGIDGDLQFKPEEIPNLLKPIIDSKYDFVAGDRFTDSVTGERRRPENMPRNKYWANKLGSWIVSKLSKQKFSDVTCGFRAYNRKAMAALNISSNYTYTQESFQQLAQKRLNIAPVPVSVIYYSGRKSRVVTNFPKFILSSAVNILRSFRDFAPLRFFGILGLACFMTGVALLSFLGWHWVQTQALSPYKAVGFVGLYFVTMAFLLWVVGLVADMQRRVLNNQEKIIEIQKRKPYENTQQIKSGEKSKL